MASKSVRKVSLTGSTRVGQQMIRDAANTMKKVSMELGGNAPLIVFDDADVELALNVSVPAKYESSRFLRLLLLLWVCGRVPQRHGKGFSNELNTEPWREAAQEMMVGPSGSAFRSRSQTSPSCCGQKPWW